MKRIIIFGMALIMLFSVAMFGVTACDGAEDNPNLNPCGYEVCVCEKDTPIPNPCEQDPCICEENNNNENKNPVEREWGFSACGRFALSIYVQETTLPHGQDFLVNIVLKNISDYDVSMFFNELL